MLELSFEEVELKTDVIDMLVYLYENGFVDIVEEDDPSPDLDELQAPCEIALPGDGRKIYLHAGTHGLAPSVRVFTEEEQIAMTPACREALLLLVRLGVLDHLSCDVVIDCLLMLDEDQLDVEDLKWAVLMAFVTEPMEKIFDSYPEESIVDDIGVSWH